MKSKWRVFFESLIFTLLILIIGFSIGFYIENSRMNTLIQDYKNFEVNALDLKLQESYYTTMNNNSCSIALASNLIFADNIYNTGLALEKYETSNQISNNNDILNEKKQYVLLKTELWMNSIILKNKCNNPFHTMVYVYSQYPSLSEDSEQKAVSNILGAIKSEKGNEIILIPIAGDLNLDSVNLMLKSYNITGSPAIIIDEKYILTGFQSQQEIEKYLN